MNGWLVDGPRPAVESAIAVSNRYRLTDAEHRVLLALALDSYDGLSCQPTYDGLCYGSAMFKRRVIAALASLEKPYGDRPALICRHGTRGRNRTTYDLLFAELQTVRDPDRSGNRTSWAGPVRPHDRSDNATSTSTQPVRQPVRDPDQHPFPDRSDQIGEPSPVIAAVTAGLEQRTGITVDRAHAEAVAQL